MICEKYIFIIILRKRGNSGSYSVFGDSRSKVQHANTLCRGYSVVKYTKLIKHFLILLPILLGVTDCYGFN